MKTNSGATWGRVYLLYSGANSTGSYAYAHSGWGWCG